MTRMTRGPGGDTTALPAVIAGTAVWLVACVALGIRDGIAPPDSGVWWWGVSVVGAGSGVIGLPFLLRRKRRLASR